MDQGRPELGPLLFSSHLCIPSAVIMRVLSTSKGLPTTEPMAPANDPAVNFMTKCESALRCIACLIGPYNPSLCDVDRCISCMRYGV